MPQDWTEEDQVNLGVNIYDSKIFDISCGASQPSLYGGLARKRPNRAINIINSGAAGPDKSCREVVGTIFPISGT